MQNAVGERRLAEELFLKVLDIYQLAELSSADQRIQIVNGFLVDVYEKLGKRDKATAYCQAIGKARPWDVNQEQVPIFITKPRWPKKALKERIEGTIKLGFIVDKQGFVKDPEIINVKGPKKLFKMSALRAVLKWRFAPKFVDGQPVDAKATYTIEFKLEK